MRARCCYDHAAQCATVKAVGASGSDRHRDVAQFGSALDWGSRGRGFKSRRPDRRHGVKVRYRNWWRAFTRVRASDVPVVSWSVQVREVWRTGCAGSRLLSPASTICERHHILDVTGSCRWGGAAVKETPVPQGQAASEIQGSGLPRASPRAVIRSGRQAHRGPICSSSPFQPGQLRLGIPTARSPQPSGR